MGKEIRTKSKIIFKHKLEVDWLTSDYIPEQGEQVIYDMEVDKDGNILELPGGRTEPYICQRIKYGDGIHTVSDLPFTYQMEEDLRLETNNKVLYRAVNEVKEDAQSQILVTHEELRQLRDNQRLKPGRFYRITDYECTTTQPDTRALKHRYDIIIQAASEDSLSTLARAGLGDDEYFNDANLEMWELMYSLDNNTEKFGWADENGKGVVYYMKDDRGNECYYDFKNIQFRRSWEWQAENIEFLQTNGQIAGETEWYYTFSWVVTDDIVDDLTMHYDLFDGEIWTPTVFNNKIEKLQIEKLYLNNNVFINSAGYDGGVIDGCYGNYLEMNCSQNTFGHSCCQNHLFPFCEGNIMYSSCNRNVLLGNARENILDPTCDDNRIGYFCYNNRLENSVSFSNLGIYCHSNIIGSQCQNIQFGNYCNRNIVGEYSIGIHFGNYCSSNIIGSRFSYITFGDKVVGNEFSDEIIEAKYINIGSGCQNIQFQLTVPDKTMIQYVTLQQGINEGQKGRLELKLNPNLLSQTYENHNNTTIIIDDIEKE